MFADTVVNDDYGVLDTQITAGSCYICKPHVIIVPLSLGEYLGIFGIQSPLQLSNGLYCALCHWNQTYIYDDSYAWFRSLRSKKIREDIHSISHSDSPANWLTHHWFAHCSSIPGSKLVKSYRKEQYQVLWIKEGKAGQISASRRSGKCYQDRLISTFHYRFSDGIEQNHDFLGSVNISSMNQSLFADSRALCTGSSIVGARYPSCLINQSLWVNFYQKSGPDQGFHPQSPLVCGNQSSKIILSLKDSNQKSSRASAFASSSSIISNLDKTLSNNVRELVSPVEALGNRIQAHKGYHDDPAVSGMTFAWHVKNRRTFLDKSYFGYTGISLRSASPQNSDRVSKTSKIWQCRKTFVWIAIIRKFTKKRPRLGAL